MDHKNLKKQEIHDIYQNELDIACFQHGMAHEDFKDLPRRTASDKVLRDKSFNIATNPNYDGYQHDLASMFYTFFDKNPSGGANKSEIWPNQQSIKELHKPINRKFGKRKLCSSFKGNMWGTDLADIQ